MNRYSYLAPVVLRIGIVAVFIWFGLSQIIDQTSWTSFVPSWITTLSGLSASTIVLFNGIFEVCMAILLAFGLFNRQVATLLFLHMILVVADIGLSATGVRDIGIMTALAAIAIQGYDVYSWHYKL